MTSHELCFLTATELARRIRRRDVSCEEVMRAHIDQIERVNPSVNAIVTFVPEQALTAARAADAALARRQAPAPEAAPLYGLPVAHKDLVLTKGMRTTFGSPLFRDFVPDTDSLIVERLKAGGAITLGKTNTPEFGAGSQTFNPVFGSTRNPYDVSKTCGGSSGGAVVALACGMVPIADGSDLGGSLRNPASFCNVAGFRPSAGRVPSWPAYNAWYSLAVLGPMARTVQDLALQLTAIAGPDARAPISIAEPGSVFARPLEREFKGVRLAWSRDLGGLPVQPEVTAVLERQRHVFEDLGIIVDEAQPDLAEADEVFKVLRAYNFELSYGALFEKSRDQMKDTVVWNIEQGIALSGPQVARAERKRTELYHRVREFMGRYDFLAAPVVQVLPFDVEQPWVREINGQPMATYVDWMRSCSFVSVTGLPAISVPCGFSAEGLPVGLQIVGQHQDDFGVLQLAHAFERHTGFWKTRPAIASGNSQV
ncbi:MAG TPA: amidase [Burkholderiales bacterium]|nr:amidase [Burkholderiales bacterium]